jgi:ribosomal-protein-alanine N-acetyltransferase
VNVAAPAAVSIRRATSADVADVAALERASYSDPWPASSFASLPENPSVYFIVARRSADNQLAGFAIAWSVLDEAELANLAVERGARRQGIGALLLDAVLENARQAATNRIYLEVRESNAAARRLYASRQFAEVGRRKKYYRAPEEDALILRREQD